MKKEVLKLEEKNQIRELYYEHGYSKSKIEKVTKHLKRSEVKEYIRDLKAIENKRTVTITIPQDQGISEIKQMFTRIYPNKKIIVKIDPELITGIKVADYDNEYELSLQGMLEDSIEYITKND